MAASVSSGDVSPVYKRPSDDPSPSYKQIVHLPKEPDWENMKQSELMDVIKRRDADYLRSAKSKSYRNEKISRLLIPGYARESISAKQLIPDCIVAVLRKYYYIKCPTKPLSPGMPGRYDFVTRNYFEVCPRCGANKDRIRKHTLTQGASMRSEWGIGLRHCLDGGYWKGSR